MPKPRKAQISLDATPYYHCVSRCVRRAFLCGEDALTGKSFEHRRGWIRNKLFELADVFSIDLAGYAIMSNHLHVLLFIDQMTAAQWEPHEVVERWHRLFNGSLLSQRFAAGESLSSAERQILDVQISCWRERLMSISWFMRCLNEPIARQANKEDGCTGRFWEGRYKLHALLDEEALIACLAYIDLNPIRAGMAQTPVDSEYTSIQDRICQLKSSSKVSNSQSDQPKHLSPFVGNYRENMPKGLAFDHKEYLQLVDWTGRAILENKRGFIPNDCPPILQRLEIDKQQWLYMTQHFESKFKGLVGTVNSLKKACKKFGYRRTPNLTACQLLFT
jgi:REP element-mobilizing transposase RayT